MVWRTKQELEDLYPHVTFYGPADIEEGVEIGEGTQIGAIVYIGKNALIGKNCKIFYHTTFCKDITIGDNVFIGPNTTFLNDKYPPTKISLPPTIHDNVIIGGGSTILPNTILYENSGVGAGSVVARSVPSGVVVIGNPAKPYCTIEEFRLKQNALTA